MREIGIMEVGGFRVGHAQNWEAATGCTVLLCDQMSPAGLDVRGGGPASRESQLLSPVAQADAINAVLLSGGSAFGLDAAGGVQTEGAAAGEQHRVDGICLGHGRQELGLPGGGSSAPDIQPGGAHLIAQEHRAAGGGLPVLGMAHTKSPHFHNSDLSHLTSLHGVFYVLFSMTDLSCRNSHFVPAPHQSTEGGGSRSV